jgi:uncharacterized membrane protein (Fun14 family)
MLEQVIESAAEAAVGLHQLVLAAIPAENNSAYKTAACLGFKKSVS